MNKLLSVSFWLFTTVIFISVLFADFLPLPFIGYASQRFILVGLLSLCIGVGMAVWVGRAGLAAWWEMLPVLLLAFGFILLALPIDDERLWAEPGMYAAFFLGFVVTGNLLGESGRKYNGVISLVYIGSVSAAFYGGTTIMVYLFALFDGVTKLSNYIPWGFANIRYWSHIATWLIPLLPLAGLIGPLKDQRLWRFFMALTAALWWWIVFLSTSRGTMLGLAFGVLFTAVLIGRPAWPWLKRFLHYLVYGIIAWLVLSIFIPSLLQDGVSIRSLKTHASGRIPLFVEAWQMSLEKFPFGLGPQSWLTHEIITEGYRSTLKFGHPHNMYLMWAAEYGWLLIGLLLILVGKAIQLFWRRRKQIRSDENAMLAIPLVAFTVSVSAALLHAGISAVFIAPGSMLIGFLVLSVFWALIIPDRGIIVDRRSRVRSMVTILVGLLISFPCYYWLKEVSGYHQAMESDWEFYHENVRAGTLPRFWLHGNYPRHPSQMP